jgi:phage tail tape-measure protein
MGLFSRYTDDDDIGLTPEEKQLLAEAEVAQSRGQSTGQSIGGVLGGLAGSVAGMVTGGTLTPVLGAVGSGLGSTVGGLIGSNIGQGQATEAEKRLAALREKRQGANKAKLRRQSAVTELLGEYLPRGF